ncbi:hypothetical protein B0J17DRAFT_721141 [Rhizoctonia solani]|nr:hypothetical protein B0J17DRAFT_721141 [Rhizoctonia solani]
MSAPDGANLLTTCLHCGVISNYHSVIRRRDLPRSENIFASLSSPVSLDVRLYKSSDLGESAPNVVDSSHLAALGVMAPRIRSMEVAFWGAYEIIHYYPGSILAYFFTQCISKTLTTLTISHKDEVVTFFDTNSTLRLPKYVGSKLKILSTENLDRALAPLDILRAEVIYPIWTSKTYHGLVEFRLVRGGVGLGPPNVMISEAHLRGILTSSPALRTLEFSAHIVVETLPEHANVVPISVDHLQLLNILRMAPNQIGTLLRWLAPGSEPLQLAILDDVLIGGHFLSQLTGHTASLFFNPSGPHLKILAWSFFDFSYGPPNYSVQDYPNICIRLNTLLLSGCYFDRTALPDLLGKSSAITIQRLLFWNCDYDPGPGPKYQTVCADNIEHMLNLCPEVKIIDEDPARDWWGFSQ